MPSEPLPADDPALRASDDLADARRHLDAADVDPDAERHRAAILAFVDEHPDALHRSCRKGHLTGSALVVDAAGERVVLLHHRKLQRWLQPGGHCDGDANLAAVALREATEETGIEGLRVHPVAIDLDVHEVDPPDDGPHLHLDARFLVVAPPGAEPPGNHESTAIRWATPDEAEALGLDAGTRRMIRHGLATLGSRRGVSGLVELGWDDAWAELADDVLAALPDGEVGRIVRQDRGWVQVATADGIVPARTRQDRVGTPVVGDWVVLADEEVAAVLERRNALRRADPVGEGEQVLAANLDRVLVVLGLDRPIKAGRVHRAVAQAWDADAEPIAVLTKADLVDDPAGAAAEVGAEHPGLDVVAVSSHTGAGLDELRAHVQGGTVVLLGESGAGKSSLLNALGGDALAETGAVRAGDAKGRHTTTRRELHLLAGGGLVVDTPGVRAIGVYAVPEAIDAAFRDIEELAERCRFADCAHDHEPGCAVQAAVAGGELRPERLEEFRHLHAEAEWAMLPEHERRGRRRPG